MTRSPIELFWTAKNTEYTKENTHPPPPTPWISKRGSLVQIYYSHMTFLDLFCLTFPFWRSFPAIQSYLIHIVPANERNLLYPDLHPSHAFSGEKVKGSLQCTSTVHQTTGSDTCPRSFDNCQPASTSLLPEDELKCRSEVGETAGSSSLSPRFHSWRDSPWGGHQVVFLDGVLRVLTHCCFNSWGKGGRGGLGWPYVCCHRVIYD